jgi:transcriptional regulator with XRE-family HTH domain
MERQMSKRNKIINETIESKRLKELRLKHGLSLRKLADIMNLSQTRVHQMEIGREDITSDYLKLFCKCLGICDLSGKKLFDKSDQDNELLEECFELLRGLNQRKVEVVYEVLRVL